MYKRALIPLDGSGVVAEGVVPFTLEIAGPLGLDVTVLRVVVPEPPLGVVEVGPIVVEHTEELCAEAETISSRSPPSFAPAVCGDDRSALRRSRR